MSQINLQTFRELAKGDYTLRRLDQEGKVEVYGKGLKGRIAKWIRKKFSPGRFHAENKKIMQSFVQAIEGRYGKKIAQIAREHLNIEGGKPLTSRKISQVLEKVKEHIQSINRSRAEHIIDSLCSYGKLANMNRNEINELKEIIRNKINLASKNGETIVSGSKMIDIATKEIHKFLEVHELATNNQEKNILLNFIRNDNDIKTPEGLRAIWQMKEQVHNLIDKINQDCSTDELISQLKTFFDASEKNMENYFQSLKQAGKTEIGSDEITAFAGSVFEIGIETGNYSRQDLEQIYQKLNSEKMKAVKDALFALSERIFLAKDDQESGKFMVKARKMFNFLSHLQDVCGKKIGLSMDQIKLDIRPLEKVSKLPDMDLEIAISLSHNGFEPIKEKIQAGLQKAAQKQLQEIKDYLKVDQDMLPQPERETMESIFEQTAQRLTERGATVSLGEAMKMAEQEMRLNLENTALKNFIEKNGLNPQILDLKQKSDQVIKKMLDDDINVQNLNELREKIQESFENALKEIVTTFEQENFEKMTQISSAYHKLFVSINKDLNEAIRAKGGYQRLKEDSNVQNTSVDTIQVATRLTSFLERLINEGAKYTSAPPGSEESKKHLETIKEIMEEAKSYFQRHKI